MAGYRAAMQGYRDNPDKLYMMRAEDPEHMPIPRDLTAYAREQWLAGWRSAMKTELRDNKEQQK